MDFQNIVLEGFINAHHNLNLEQYFIRKFKLANRDDFYELEEFFQSCFIWFCYTDEQSKNSYHHRKYLCRAASKRDTAFWNAVHLLHRFYH